MPSTAVRRLYRPGIATVLAACALMATAANVPQAAVPLIALSALSAIACVAH